MGRRANGEGSIFRRGDGRWTAQMSYPDENGQTQRRTVYGRTQADVRAKLKDARQRVEVGDPVKDAAITLSSWLEDWTAKALEASDRKQATKDLYATMVRAHLKPTLGHVELGKLKPSDVEALIVRKRSEGLSASTIRTMYTVLRGALEVAVRDGLVRRNVAATVRRPATERTEAVYLTTGQAQQLLTVLAGDRLEALYRLMLATGLRRGEALALRWDDVDLTENALRVRGTLSRTSNGLEITEPKTERSRRTVPLPRAAVEALKAHRKRQAADQLAAGRAWQPCGLVFATEVGTALEPRNVLRRFDALARKAGLEGVHLHTLRHSAASFLLAAGTHTKVVQEHLGHSSYAITADIYSHVAPAQAREAADKLDAALQW
jgi:integrase